MRCITCNIEMEYLGGVTYVCPNCSLISNDTVIDYSIYDKSYHVKYERYSNSVLGTEINKLRTAQLLCTLTSRDSNVLDFGCGSGSFVHFCKDHNINIQGFDINPYSSFCSVENLFDYYDTVTFWDSIEHLQNPVKVLKGLSTKKVIICTPSTDDFKGDISDISTWHHFYVEEHVHYFNEQSLKMLLQSAGFCVESITYAESKLRKSGGDKNIITISGRK